MPIIVEGTNTGTSGNDIFEVTTAISSFSVNGQGGTDRLKADISLLGSWSTSSIEIVELFGSKSSPFFFSLGAGGSSRTADVSKVTSVALVDIQSTGSQILGGSQTYLDARTDHVITNFDMQSGAYSGTYQDRTLTNTYQNLKGVVGGSGNDRVLGTDGADRVALESGINYFDGRDGLDKVGVIGTRGDFSVSHSSSTITVSRISNPGGDVTEAVNVERVEYLNSSLETIGQLAFDLSGNAGQTYRLYQAAFARTPDTAGLSHNVNLMDNGLTLRDMSSAFIGSAEFIQRYGSNTTDTAFINALYNNVLGRDADAGGLAGWQQRLADGSWDRTGVLIGFSESAENQTLVGQAIQDGIWLA